MTRRDEVVVGPAARACRTWMTHGKQSQRREKGKSRFEFFGSGLVIFGVSSGHIKPSMTLIVSLIHSSNSSTQHEHVRHGENQQRVNIGQPVSAYNTSDMSLHVFKLDELVRNIWFNFSIEFYIGLFTCIVLV